MSTPPASSGFPPPPHGTPPPYPPQQPAPPGYAGPPPGYQPGPPPQQQHPGQHPAQPGPHPGQPGPPPGVPGNGRVAARATNLVKVYGEGHTAVRALDQVSVAFGSGQFTAIMGPSGSGKSTLMHCLAGLDNPTAGWVHLGDAQVTGLPDKQLTLLRRDRVGFIFQSFNLLPTLTAEQNILLPLELAGRKPDPQWLQTIVGSLEIGDRLTHRPSELSGGQQQRVAIARALVGRPEVIFADEPTGALDSKNGARLLGFLRTSVKELGQTVVMVTHDPTAASYADRVVMLADGRLAGEVHNPTADTVIDALRRLGG